MTFRHKAVEIPYDEVKGLGYYWIELICEKCGKILNRTGELHHPEYVKELYREALVNPLLGWCDDCDLKPIPRIYKFTPKFWCHYDI